MAKNGTNEKGEKKEKAARRPETVCRWTHGIDHLDKATDWFGRAVAAGVPAKAAEKILKLITSAVEEAMSPATEKAVTEATAIRGTKEPLAVGAQVVFTPAYLTKNPDFPEDFKLVYTVLSVTEKTAVVQNKAAGIKANYSQKILCAYKPEKKVEEKK